MKSFIIITSLVLAIESQNAQIEYVNGVKPIPVIHDILDADLEHGIHSSEYFAGVKQLPISNQIVHESESGINFSKRAKVEYHAGVEAIPISDEVIIENDMSGIDVTLKQKIQNVANPKPAATITDFVDQRSSGEANDDDFDAEYYPPEEYRDTTDIPIPTEKAEYQSKKLEMEPSDSLNLKASLIALGGAILALLF